MGVRITKQFERRSWRQCARTLALVAAFFATIPDAPALFALDKMVDPRLEGTWRIERVEGDDEWNGEASKIRLTFKGGKLISSDDEADDPAEILVQTDVTKNPSQMDWSWTIKGEREVYDVNLPGIYTIDKDGNLKICFAKHEHFPLCLIVGKDSEFGPRPSSFKEKETICILAKRVKIKEKK